MNMQEILSRIDQRHLVAGTSDASASRAATGSPDLIRNWRRAVRQGGKPGASTTTLAKLAEALQTNVSWLMDGTGSPDDTSALGSPLRYVTVTGHIQAGHFAETWEWDDAQQYQIAVPSDPALAPYTLYAAELRGTSMNRRWSEGTVVVFTNVMETQEEPVVGKRYVVERRRLGGDAEFTAKKLVRDQDGKHWLMPESDDPRYQSPISIEEGTGSDEDIVTIHGRIWYSVNRE